MPIRQPPGLAASDRAFALLADRLGERRLFLRDLFLNRRQAVLPMHGTAELGKGLEAAIKRQLGLK